VTRGLGVNVAPDGSDDPRAIAAAGATWVRFVLHPDQDTRAIASRYRKAGLQVLVCCDADTERGFVSHADAAELYVERVGDQVDALQLPYNEFDQVGATSSTATEEQTYQAMKAWAEVWRPTGVLLVGPNCASGQPGRWTARLARLVTVCALSRYPSVESGGAARMGDGIYGPDGYTRFGNEIWITEFPIWTVDYLTAALEHSQYPPIAYDWHSWHESDQAYWHDGLLDLAGHPTWRLDAFTKAARSLSLLDRQRLALLAAPAGGRR
jgi:hypothetical protein